MACAKSWKRLLFQSHANIESSTLGRPQGSVVDAVFECKRLLKSPRDERRGTNQIGESSREVLNAH